MYDFIYVIHIFGIWMLPRINKYRVCRWANSLFEGYCILRLFCGIVFRIFRKVAFVACFGYHIYFKW